MKRDTVELEMLLEHARDQVQAMADLLAAVVANAGGIVEIRPEDVAVSRGQIVDVLAAPDSPVVLVRLVKS